MHQVGFVEHIAVQPARLRLLHDDLRGLRNAGQQLVRGVGGEDHGVLAARTVLADGMHVLVVLVESRVRQPRLVEMQRVHIAAQLFLDHLDVVDHAVVGALRQRQDARILVDGLARERIGLDLLADVLRIELFQRDGADDAQVVARGAQEHRMAPVIVIACRMDLWQLRSTTTTSPAATLACQTTLLEVEVPLVTKKQWSAWKMRAALISDSATGPV